MQSIRDNASATKRGEADSGGRGMQEVTYIKFSRPVGLGHRTFNFINGWSWHTSEHPDGVFIWIRQHKAIPANRRREKFFGISEGLVRLSELSLCLSVSLSLSHLLTHSLSTSHFHSLSLSLFHYLSFSLCLCLSVTLTLTLSFIAKETRGRPFCMTTVNHGVWGDYSPPGVGCGSVVEVPEYWPSTSLDEVVLAQRFLKTMMRTGETSRRTSRTTCSGSQCTSGTGRRTWTSW